MQTGSGDGEGFGYLGLSIVLSHFGHCDLVGVGQRGGSGSS